MHLACWYDQSEVVKLIYSLLTTEEIKAMQEAKDAVISIQNGETPYILATVEGATSCLGVLIEHNPGLSSISPRTNEDDDPPLPQYPKESYPK